MNILERIFHEAPAGCEEVRLSCRVYFKNPVCYILTGWLHYQHGTWQRLESQSDQPKITQADLDKALLAAGWSMDDRPTRRNTTELTYTFRRATGEHYNFKLRSKTADYTERRVQELAFDQFEQIPVGERQHAAILQAPEYARLWA